MAATARWTESEDSTLRRFYEAFTDKAVPVKEIAQLVGHTPGAVRYRAHKLGLSDPHRPRVREGADLRRTCPVCNGSFTARRPSDTQKTCSRSCAARQRGMGRYGRGSKTGKRPDLGDTFFRSAWEANYSRYLNLLRERGEILRWEYEPQIFRFPVKRGNRSYMPDFKVWYSDHLYEWHEVKGWMDNASKIKLRRFALHHPNESLRLKLIERPQYKAIEAEYKALIPGWES